MNERLWNTETNVEGTFELISVLEDCAHVH